MSLTPTIRIATQNDAQAIADIYNFAVETSTATLDMRPRTLAEQTAWISARSGAFSVIVAEVADEVVGFSSLSQFKERPAYQITVESSVYVRESFAGRGIGTTLVQAILDVARASGFHSVIARIESTRRASLRLHEKCGYEFVGTEQEVGRKFGRYLNMTTMQRMLHSPASSHPQPTPSR